jgi:hypothetical protein
MNVGFLIVSIIFLAYSLRFSFFWWFQSKEYIKMNRKKRKEYRKTLFFMPQILVFDYYDGNPEFEKWINRMVGLIFVMAGVFGFIISIRGPFR